MAPALDLTSKKNVFPFCSAMMSMPWPEAFWMARRFVNPREIKYCAADCSPIRPICAAVYLAIAFVAFAAPAAGDGTFGSAMN